MSLQPLPVPSLVSKYDHLWLIIALMAYMHAQVQFCCLVSELVTCARRMLAWAMDDDNLSPTHLQLSFLVCLNSQLNEVNLSHNKLSDVTGLKGLPHITVNVSCLGLICGSCKGKAVFPLREIQISTETIQRAPRQ